MVRQSAISSYLFASAIVLALLILTDCGTPKSIIVGTWELDRPSGLFGTPPRYQFTEDGKVFRDRSSGTYEFLSDTRLKMDFEAFGLADSPGIEIVDVTVISRNRIQFAFVNRQEEGLIFFYNRQ